MDYLKSKRHQNKLTSILSTVIGILLLLGSWYQYDSSTSYKPVPQQVFLDEYNRPIGLQDLMKDTYHNLDYRAGDDGETPGDFLKEALLSIFSYKKSDLTSGLVLNDFIKWCSEDEAISLYRDSFVNLGQQKVVLAQDGIARARVIGDFEYIGSAAREYESTAGLTLPALTHKFEGTMIVTIHGNKEYPTVFKVTALVQRALIQDKIKGYQIVELELR